MCESVFYVLFHSIIPVSRCSVKKGGLFVYNERRTFEHEWSSYQQQINFNVKHLVATLSWCHYINDQMQLVCDVKQFLLTVHC